MLERLKNIANIFPESKFGITTYRSPALSADDFSTKDLSSNLRVLPFEAINALSKIGQGDVKSFIDTHIEAHVCTSISSLCRDAPYRIKYSVHLDNEFLSIYSECIDLEILFATVFGDLIKFFGFADGYRDDKTFRCTFIPRFLAQNKSIALLSSLVGYVGVKLRGRQLTEIINELPQLGSSISEIIFVTPYLNSWSKKVIESMFHVVAGNPSARLFIVTTAPSIFSARDYGVSYKEYLTTYIEVLDMIRERSNTYLCDSEPDNIEIIINRATYMISNDPRPSLNSTFKQIRDSSFIDNFTLKYLRDCICSSALARTRRLTAY